MANTLTSYFKLYRNAAVKDARGAETQPSLLWSLVHYIVLALGIIAYPFVEAYTSGKISSFDLSIPMILFALIVAMAIYPTVFKKSFNTEEPGLVQLSITFASGLGYQSIFTLGASAAFGG